MPNGLQYPREKNLEDSYSHDESDTAVVHMVTTATKKAEDLQDTLNKEVTNSLDVGTIDKTGIGQIKKLSKYTEPEFNTEIVSTEIASSKKSEFNTEMVSTEIVSSKKSDVKENSQSELELELVQK